MTIAGFSGHARNQLTSILLLVARFELLLYDLGSSQPIIQVTAPPDLEARTQQFIRPSSRLIVSDSNFDTEPAGLGLFSIAAASITTAAASGFRLHAQSACS